MPRITTADVLVPIYRAVLDKSQWPRALVHVSLAFEATLAHVRIHRHLALPPIFCVSAAVRREHNVPSWLDSVCSALHQRGADTPRTYAFLREPFGSEVDAAYGHALGMWFDLDTECRATLVLVRHGAAPSFDASDEAELGLLPAHLKRAHDDAPRGSFA